MIEEDKKTIIEEIQYAIIISSFAMSITTFPFLIILLRIKELIEYSTFTFGFVIWFSGMYLFITRNLFMEEN